MLFLLVPTGLTLRYNLSRFNIKLYRVTSIYIQEPEKNLILFQNLFLIRRKGNNCIYIC